ncbi:MAG TPA: L,D-transpeptidase [Pyrinomonadaceae bacterium]|nr:L,D-transpeptidase [Pyrinomonadaceae bacterium]
MSHLTKLFIVFSIALLVLCGCGKATRSLSAKAATPTPTRTQADSDSRAPLKLPLKDPRIEVHKGERKLLLYSDGRLVRAYRVGLGLNPTGDKERSGDHRTPEGDFYIFIKNPKSAFYLSLGVSYPSLAHAQRGLRDGKISKAQHDQIAAAIKLKKTPPQHTRLGGDIFIHGNGASSDWTWGCVALENEDMKELYDVIAVGTPVTIKP